MSGQQAKRPRYSSPLCPPETPLESKMSAKAKAEYFAEDDDEDDEEIPHPVSQQSPRIKQEPDLAAFDGANTTSAIRYNTLRTRTPSTPSDVLNLSQTRATTTSFSSRANIMRREKSSNISTDGDEEMLLLRLEENRLLQQMRMKELQREASCQGS